MKAVTYQGFKDVKVKEVNDPKIEKPDDIIVRLTSTAICGSDLHLIHGMIPNMPEDFIIGHEPMGIVEEAGPNVTKVKKGDRVIIPFNISCGECFYCKTSWKVNATIPTLTAKRAHFSAIRKRPAGMQVDKQSSCVSPTPILSLFASRMTARLKMRNSC